MAAARPLDVFFGPVSGVLAPILAEVLYDMGPIWPLAVFGPAMALTAIFSGQLFCWDQNM